MNYLVDRLGVVKAKIAELKAEEDAIKAQLIASGITVAEGEFYRAAVSLITDRVSVDWKAVAEKLEPSRQLITAYTSRNPDVYQVRVSARKSN